MSDVYAPTVQDRMTWAAFFPVSDGELHKFRSTILMQLSKRRRAVNDDAVLEPIVNVGDLCAIRVHGLSSQYPG